MEPRLHDGDLVVAYSQDAYGVGDVVAYRVPEGEVGAGASIIHRIIGGSARTGYIVKGDNRVGQDVWRPKPGDVIGRMRFDAPRLAACWASSRRRSGWPSSAAWRPSSG